MRLDSTLERRLWALKAVRAYVGFEVEARSVNLATPAVLSDAETLQSFAAPIFEKYGPGFTNDLFNEAGSLAIAQHRCSVSAVIEIATELLGFVEAQRPAAADR